MFDSTGRNGILNFSTIVAVLLVGSFAYDHYLVNPSTPETATEGLLTHFQDNGTIAIEGLQAPADIEDSYVWARDKLYASFLAQREIQAEYKLLTSAPPADIKLNIKPDFHVYDADNNPKIHLPLDMGDLDEIAFACNSLQDRNKQNNTPCITREKIERLKKSNAILWGRFEKLPSHKTCSYIQTLDIMPLSSGRDIHRLVQIKSADLIYKAQSGNAAAAIKEWINYAIFTRRCLGGTSVNATLTAMYSLWLKTITDTFNDLLLIDPNAALAYQNDINGALAPLDDSILIQPFLPINEVLRFVPNLIKAEIDNNKDSMTFKYIPNFLHTAIPTNSFLKDLNECGRKRKELLSTDTLFAQQEKFEALFRCADEFDPDLEWRFFRNALTSPGNPVSNLIYYLLAGGFLNNSSVAVSVYTRDINMRLLRLGLDMSRRDIPPEKIQEELNNTPESLQNPFTNTPFQYVREKHALHMIVPGNEKQEQKDYWFYLP